jgi:hypothetical protein
MTQHLLDRGITLNIGGPMHKNAEEYAHFQCQAQIVQLIERKRKQNQTTPPILATFPPVSADPSPLALKPSIAVVSVVVHTKKKDKKKTSNPPSSMTGTPSSFLKQNHLSHSLQ